MKIVFMRVEESGRYERKRKIMTKKKKRKIGMIFDRKLSFVFLHLIFFLLIKFPYLSQT